MDLLWWHWLVLGMVLIGLELVVPSFTIIWFGLGAVLVSIILAIFPGYSLPAQILTWTVASALFTFAWFRFFNPRNNKTFAGTSKGAVVGEIGLVIRGAEPYAKGVVKFQLPLLGADEWPCMADDSLEVGDRVRVVDVEGHVMKVEKTAKRERL
jgi:membrane protein implicated in regulation of membrane protease activity